MIVDDHAMVLSAIAGLVDMADEFDVVAQCADADEGAEAALRLRPDILLMDIDMPGISSFDTARVVKDQHPGVRVAFLTAHTHDTHIERALSVGASGYITKHEQPGDMLGALRKIAGGGTYFSDEVEQRIVLTRAVTPGAGRSASRDEQCGTRLSTLSPRELEVLEHIASGMTKKEIAAMLFLSVKTIDNHTTNLMGKLDIHDRVGLTKYAIREGFVTP
ncbi:MAG: response regulator transcription factor [Planctomycetota bacterium]